MRKKVISVKKYKSKLGKKKLLVIYGMILSLVISGCSLSKKSNKTYNPVQTTSYSQSVDTKIENSSSKFKVINEVDNTIINVKDYDEFIKFIDNVDVNYPGEELYNVENSYNNYKNNSEKHGGTSQILVNGRIDNNVLYNSVINNNSNYNIKDLFTGKEMDSSTIKKTCDYLSDAINDEFSKDDLIDKQETACNLSNLKMFNVNSASIAFVTDDNVLAISPSMMKVQKMINKDVDTFQATIYHEAMHFMQKSCSHSLAKSGLKQSVGIAQKYTDTGVNSMYWRWVYEASAELNAANQLNIKPTTYNSMINYLESLEYTNCMANNTKSKYENISFDKDINLLFNNLSVTTQKDKYDLIKYMYSMDIIQCENEDFIKAYNEKYGTNLATNTQEISDMKQTIRPCSCLSLSKMFYKNLTMNIANKNIQLNDVYYLISLFEADLNSHLKYTEENNYKYTRDFMEKYNEIQTQFFITLSQNLNISYDEVVLKFDDYALYKNVDGNKKLNCDLSWINDKTFISKMQEKLLISYTTNIKNSFNKLKVNTK